MKLKSSQRNRYWIGIKIQNQILINEDFVKIYIDCSKDLLLERIKISEQKKCSQDGIKEVKKIKSS